MNVKKTTFNALFVIGLTAGAVFSSSAMESKTLTLKAPTTRQRAKTDASYLQIIHGQPKRDGFQPKKIENIEQIKADQKAQRKAARELNQQRLATIHQQQTEKVLGERKLIIDQASSGHLTKVKAPKKQPGQPNFAETKKCRAEKAAAEAARANYVPLSPGLHALNLFEDSLIKPHVSPIKQPVDTVVLRSQNQFTPTFTRVVENAVAAGQKDTTHPVHALKQHKQNKQTNIKPVPFQLS
jgi:hypothetical protein